MAKLGFKRLQSDPSVYLYERDNVKIIVPVFVDDITLASKDGAAIDRVVEELKQELVL